jgi:hypothetical protein
MPGPSWRDPGRAGAMPGPWRACLVGILLGAQAAPALAQFLYKSPDGAFTMQVPGGWQPQPDADAHQVVFKRGALSVTVMVWAQNPADPVTVADYLAGTEASLRGQCPTYQTRRRNRTTLLGLPAPYLLSTCSDPKSPAVADTAAVLTPGGNLVAFLVIAPLADYFPNLPAFDAMRDSLRLPADASAGVNPAQGGGEGKPARQFDIEKACIVGAFAADECTRRSALEQAVASAAGDGADASAAAPAAAPGAIYRDGQGRFTLSVPDGWSATAQGEQGAAGVQLRLGTSFINVIPVAEAKAARDLVLQKELRIAQLSNSARQPPFGAAGIVLLDGNGVEVALDHFEGVNAQGAPVRSVIAAVSELALEPRHFLRLEASAPAAQGEQLVGLVFGVARSVVFAAEAGR